MTLLAIPNVSEGRSHDRLRQMSVALGRAGARVLDVDPDAFHHRAVFTVTAEPESLIEAMVTLASDASSIDMRSHDGVHPRLGGLDVCPFVPFEESRQRAIEAARATAGRIAEELELPVYLYGWVSDRGLELPEIRRSAPRGLEPDLGPPAIDPARGAVCVGARDVLIAFNVWIRADGSIARKIAASVRTATGGPVGIRAIGIEIEGPARSQVSMNLIAPDQTGIEAAFDAVATNAERDGVSVIATELVGLIPERFLPSPDAQAARLLLEPGRSLEQMLKT